MNQVKRLKAYSTEALLKFSIEGDIYSLQGKKYKILDDKTMIFDTDMNFLPERVIALEEGVTGYIYEFGGRWYTHEWGADVSLNEVRHVGEAVQKLPTKAFLGIRSGYELMNGVGLYKNWAKKAKFLGIETLAICERKTLSGCLVFQAECTKLGIKSIFGMTTPIINDEGKIFEVKIYVRNLQGWFNLLKLNTILNVDKEMAVPLDILQKNREDLFIIADPKSMDFEDCFPEIDFYQLDTVVFKDVEKDAYYLDNLEKFILSDIEAISITDAFYIDKGDHTIRELVWNISKSFDFKTENQFLKNKDVYAAELISMFEKGSNGWVKLFQEAVKNEAYVAENCNFQYDTDTRHLPKYVMTEEEAAEHKDNNAFFLHLIKKGFAEKGIENPQVYIDRLKTEIDILRMGDVIDYFLSLYDIVQFARRENILTGIGRGSAGGSLVAYLLDIIKIDPMEFNLLFERFLNSGRMGEWQERPSYIITLEDGSEVELPEGSVLRVKRGDRETIVMIEELIEGDEVIRY
jgi:DNA polymerase III subunit alpha